MNDKAETMINVDGFLCGIFGLLDTVAMPMFEDMRCTGYLNSVVKNKHITKEEAALEWMECNFDALRNTLFAVREMVEVLVP